MPTLRTLLDEIHRRSLWQVLSVYLAGGWFALEVIQTLQDELILPRWVFRAGLVLLLIGLPIVLITTYAQRGIRARPGGDVPGVSRLFTWRNAIAGGVLAFALLGAFTVVRVFVVAAPGLSEGEEGPAAIAVFPFNIGGDGDLTAWREGVPDVLSRALSAIDELRVVDVGRVLKAVEETGDDGRLDTRTAASLAGRLGARYYVLGGLNGTGSRTQLYASLYDVRAPDRPIADADADTDSSAAGVMGLVSRVSAELVLQRLGSGSARAVRSAARATDSPSALRAFLAAEQAIRVSQYPDAIEDLQQATDEDGAFALAWFRMSIAAALMETDGAYSEMLGMVPDALPRALALADRLGDRDRRLLEAYDAFRRGEGDAAEEGYRTILRANPDDTEARFFLAQVLFRLNPPRGRSFQEAREVFERVLEDDPGFTCPL